MSKLLVDVTLTHIVYSTILKSTSIVNKLSKHRGINMGSSKAHFSDFCAIDFETACPNAASACAVALVRVRNNEIVKTLVTYIKPPVGMEIIPAFTEIHGIRNADVKESKTFEELWPELKEFIGNDMFVAHSAPFDRNVLHSTLDYYGIKHPYYKFECTVVSARKKWPKPIVENHKLNTVCKFLNIELNHHEALSDALACAQIYIRSGL